MLSKNKQKYILSLSRKKIRDQYQAFIAEGDKLLEDLLNSDLKIELIACTDDWHIKYKHLIADNTETLICTSEDLKKISSLKSPARAMGVFKQIQNQLEISDLKNQLCLFLDNIQDPGNLGTIIRLADWFGISNVICSTGCADVYNSKTIQSTMGAICRVNIHYVNPVQFLNNYSELALPIFGTFLDGTNLYQQNISENGLIIMGNEGQGISPDVEKYVTHRLLIPSYPDGIPSSESLNVSVATAIVCAEFRRQKTQN